MKRICLTALVFLGLAMALSAQVMNGSLVPEQAAKPVSPGELAPSFWIGAQAITTVGANLQTGASGMSYDGNQTWVSFNVAFLDSHYDTPKKVVSADDPGSWSLSFRLQDPTARINSYSSGPEVNFPSWNLGVQGNGWRLGFFTENNQTTGNNLGGDQTNGPGTTLTGANQALYLGQATAGSGAVTGTETVVQVSYNVSSAAYASYEVPNLGKVALTVGSGSDPAATGAKNSWAGVLDWSASPLGPGSIDEPLTFTLKGNLIGGTNFSTGNPVGFGLQTQLDDYLDDDVVLSPVVAFDGRLNDTWTPGVSLAANSLSLETKVSGGLLFALSPKQWVSDDYSELPSQGTFENVENAKIQKFTYVQVMADFFRQSLANNSPDMDLVFRAEEPDGIVGLDDNLGWMSEFRVGQLLKANPGASTTWSTIGRLSYDLSAHRVSPYVLWFYDSTNLAKLRFGVRASLVKGTALEVNYMTSNLTSVTSSPLDKGRIEVLLGLSTDPSFTMIKNMFFNYEGATE
jgi:hypothetical protein